jgi:hypothetical protein
MPRINEHQISFENIDYKLTFYPKESAVINLNEKIYIGNRTELLKKYITHLGLNLKLDGLTTQQLSSIVLNHITELNNNGFKKTTPKVDSKRKDKPNISDKPSKMNLKIELENLNLSKNFKVVMICANKKNASSFDEYPFENFVNNIAVPPLNPSEHHPDDPTILGKITWRQYLINHQNDNNLLEAFNLYKRNEYRCLHRKYKNNFYILSAGWGLVNSEFKLPKYDITFSNNAKQRNKRSKNINIAPVYKDFNQFNDESKKLLINPEEDILYIGGKDYLKLFYALTQNMPNRKIIYYK